MCASLHKKKKKKTRLTVKNLPKPLSEACMYIPTGRDIKQHRNTQHSVCTTCQTSYWTLTRVRLKRIRRNWKQRSKQAAPYFTLQNIPSWEGPISILESNSFDAGYYWMTDYMRLGSCSGALFTLTRSLPQAVERETVWDETMEIYFISTGKG